MILCIIRVVFGEFKNISIEIELPTQNFFFFSIVSMVSVFISIVSITIVYIIVYSFNFLNIFVFSFFSLFFLIFFEFFS